MSKKDKIRTKNRSFLAVGIATLLIVVLGISHNSLITGIGDDSPLVSYNAFAMVLVSVVGMVFAAISMINSKSRTYKVWSVIFSLYFVVSLVGAVYILMVTGVDFLG